ncbi:hypothetical protein CI109_104611 [Kwoniella shandongensis]|uniref:Uncharacterized protein n=1 Tax=Kwoniella shandongensis TaxID=1734106 RepID=A0A5M6BV87_9TREE|nr:uncharacterized protein CI109_004777 [Kwoniella shandongensis]KAA5526777.1 hypothetical protein CI109_004777 [Kwoniella shandongensis]
MAEKPLIIPFLLDASLPSDNALPVNPTHVVAWVSEPGSSRRIALAGNDNTVWIVSNSQAPRPSRTTSQPSSSLLPTIRTPISPTFPTSPRRARPSHPRNSSYSGPSRPRATSSTSSIITNSSKRRTSAFSPPPSARQLPITTLSSATASAAPPDVHTHRSSLSDRTDLRDQLREHKERREEGVVGLGIGAIGRRGLTGVHGKEEQETHSGAASPKSIASATTDSGGNTSRFGFWRGSNSIDEASELREQMEEVEVDRAMEKEKLEDQKEREDLKMVEAAIERSPTPAMMVDKDQGRHSNTSEEARKVSRVILASAGRGKIVAMKVFEEVDALCILRDEGLLDVFSLTTLSSIAHVNLGTSEELKPSSTASSSKTTLKIPHFWSWRDVHVAKNGETSLLVAHGLPWPCALPSPNGEVTRVVMLNVAPQGCDIIARLELPGEGDIGVCRDAETNFIIHATPQSLTSYPIIFPSLPTNSSNSPLPKTSPQLRSSSSLLPSSIARSATPNPSQVKEQHEGLRKSASHSQLKEAAETSSANDRPEKGFAKYLAVKRADWGRKGKDEDKVEEVIPGIGEGKEVERDGYGNWKRIKLCADGDGVGWADDAVDLFHCDGKTMSVRGTMSTPSKQVVKDVAFSSNWRDVVIRTETSALVYTQKGIVDERNGNLRFDRTTEISSATSIFLGHDHHLLVVRLEDVLSVDVTVKDPQSQIVFSPTSSNIPSKIGHLTPTSIEDTFVSDPQGNIYAQPFDAIFAGFKAASPDDAPTVDRLDSPVTCSKIVNGPKGSRDRFLVAGDEDGVVRIWTVNPFKLCGSWSLFAWPVESLSLLDMPQAGSLQGSLLCTSKAGTIGIISLVNMEQLYLIPASRTPLRRVFVEGKDILIAYANGKARVWNTQTQEFRRSTGLDAAEEMLQTGDWAEVNLGQVEKASPLVPAVTTPPPGSELGRLLNLDLRELGRWLHSSKNNPNHSPLRTLRNLLSIFLTFGIDERVDGICTENLGIRKPQIPIVVGHADQAQELCYATGVEAWRVSPSATGLRQLVIITLLRPFLDSPDHERWAAEVIAFYTAALPSNIVEPDLDFFASYYLDSSADVHQAARMLFAARVGRMSEAEIDAVVEAKQSDLPSRRSTVVLPASAAHALTLLGGIALHKYQSMNPSALKAIAESVTLYLHETKGLHLPLAVELCSKGFATWQSYVDPSDLLRRLFHLSTSKESASSTYSISGTSIAAQSRLAVLHVASSNAPLFMSTLSMDILDARSAEARSSIMKLCVFMARKKPAVLENGLPRIAEAVVKSLDPNVGKMRDDVWQAATVILNELVLAFSTIDFHSGTQRLAVGTHEGAVIMYDLKTASRLYVIEPHKHPVSAVTFSPDGRRLITVSLEEGSVTVWKVGSSLSGFFNVGAPPRQGGEKGEPFKRIEFMRVDDVPLDSTSALSDVQITWPGARQARVMIKETALTFET